MNVPPDQIILHGEDIAITAVPKNSAWLVAIERDSPQDKIITDYLAAVQAAPKGSAPPSMPPLGMLGVGVNCVIDTKYLVMVKAGQEGKKGPNDTEWQIMNLISSHGRKVKREAAQ